ncbi:MAG: hypothetical protein QNK04_20005 [Myxococcota bacterium]|nr:hypothetical protein [Myxococcota bacterium]
MSVRLDEESLRTKLAVLLEGPEVKRGLQQTVGDPFLLAFFLMSVSEGEAMGEAGVAAIREEEIARLIHDIDRQEREEGGHKEGTLDLARELFPEYFDQGEYRYRAQLTGREYYVGVLQENRQRLKERGVYSRLNLYLTTTFGYEVMVVLYYGAMIAAVEASELPGEVRRRVAVELRRILAEEETHLEIEEQHNRLLEADRSRLGPRAVELLDALGGLTDADYHEAAELSVREVAKMIARYATGAEYRRAIESAVA